MKYFSGKTILAGALLTAMLEANAQQTNPAAYANNVLVSYVRSWVASSPQANADTLKARGLKDVKQTTQYIDGLGRPLQAVAKQGSLVSGSTANDLITPSIYDNYGREVVKYLPFASNLTGGYASTSDGLMKLNPFQQDSTFNKGMFSDESWYYSLTSFQSAPFDKPTESFAPGNNWVGTSPQSLESNRHSIKTKYWTNTTADSVRLWTVTDVTNAFGTYATSGLYAAGTLQKNITVDEANRQTIEFKDLQGHVLLKKNQMSGTADDGSGKGHFGWLCTYYIYDDVGNLRCVIQPRGVELLLPGWSLTATILTEQCFRYEYDGKARMIIKKIPGAGINYMIYDARDRLVMTQDSAMRANHKWLYTLYDALNRPATTGLITDNTNYNNASYHRSHADTSIAWPNPAGYNGDEPLTKTFYDNYAWRSGEGNPLSATRSTTYDSYLQTLSNTAWPYPQAVTAWNQLTGLVTGTKVKVLGTASTYEYSVNFYDDKGRMIQTQSKNITGDSAIVTMQYGFAGQVLLSIMREGKSAPNAQTSVMLTQNSYDSLDRVVKIEKKISNTKVNSGTMPSTWSTIAQNEYDALGQLKKKKLGSALLDSLVYDYNIRGWMLGANRSYVKDTTSTTNWFGFDLGYDKTAFTVNSGNQSYAAAQYNGNITGMLWRSTGDDYLRKYDFTYDNVNRLNAADFNQLNSNAFSKAAQLNFSVRGLTYDANGNILTLNQSGWKLGGSFTIDSLSYGYNTSANSLKYVMERVTDTTKLGDFKEPVHNTSQDYTYDGNGNMIVDNNKAISQILYNHLNLPDSITITSKGTIKYVYDANGVKLQKITKDNTTGTAVTTTTVYLTSNFVNDTLQYLPTEEGRARFNTADATLAYDYFLKDHLGNVRMVLTEQQESDMYIYATMEDADSVAEQTYYGNLRETRSAVPSGYPANTPPGNLKVAKVSGVTGGHKIGPSIVLRVMAGDKINLQVTSWWATATPGTPVSPLTDLVNAIAGSVGNLPGTAHPTNQQLIGSGVLTPSATSFLGSQTYNSGRPKAFINWVLFDDRFNYVANSSGFEQVQAAGTLYPHSKTNLPITKSGYIFIYTSNETPNIDVFFDNLQVTHVRGALNEETHYYPFGLAMAGISAKALNFGDPVNKKKYNGIEYDSTFAIDEYETQLRNLDPQIGRWWQADPSTEKMEMWSPYASNYDNTIQYSDPKGNEPECCKELWEEVKSAANETWDAVTDGYVQVAKWTNDNLNPLATTAELVTGKTVNSNFTESRPRSESTMQLLAFADPEAAAEGMIAKSVVKDIVNTEAKQAGTRAAKNEAKVAVENEVSKTPNFVVDKGGQTFPVPKGSKGPLPADNGKGVKFVGGTVGEGKNQVKATMRIMDPKEAKGKAPAYPNGYIRYTSNGNQGVNMYTGKQESNPVINHIPLSNGH